MKLNVLDWNNKETGQIELSNEIFGREIRLDILHRVMNWQLAKRRAGTHAVKGKDAVQASTRKIYSQKGSGRARHGSVKAVQFRGGGIVFGPQVRSHAFSLNKKVRKLGLKVALSLKMQKNDIIIVDDVALDNVKTSLLRQKLNSLGVQKVLILGSEMNSNVIKASANLKGVDFLPVAGLNVVDLLKDRTIIIALDGIKKLEERLV